MGSRYALLLGGVVDGDADALTAADALLLLATQARSHIIEHVFVLAVVDVVELYVTGIGFRHLLRLPSALRSFSRCLLFILQLLLSLFLQPHSDCEGADAWERDTKTLPQQILKFICHIHQDARDDRLAESVTLGHFVLFLFVLGMFIVKGPMKWALFTATILSISLAWGKNFMPWTDLWLDYVPMYDKFRTVASILVIAEFTIPLLAMLALKEIVENENVIGEKYKWPFFISLALTGGVCLLFYLMPDVFFGNYVSSSEAAMLDNAVQAGYIPSEMLADILRNLNDMRRAVFTADAGRSLIIILVGCAVLLAYHYKKIKAWAMVGCLIVLCTADLWDVNKRYLNDAMFSKPQPAQQFFQKTPADEAILQDSDLYYRVVNLAVNTFNDNTTSYWHKSIGGYHAAKLRRYQELIEAHIQPQLMELFQAVSTTGGRLDSIAGDSLFPVLNMLNTKYAILPLQGGETVPVQNPWAMGNAWFVDHVFLVANADEELALLSAINPRHTAAVDVSFKGQIPDQLISAGGPADGSVYNDSTASGLTLTAYEANALTFEATTDRERLAVFSDIYYPGWQCTIDGEPADILRADYVLRAVVIPAGKHQIAFRFDPQSLHTTEAIANTALIALALLLIALVAVGVWRKRKS